MNPVLQLYYDRLESKVNLSAGSIHLNAAHETVDLHSGEGMLLDHGLLVADPWVASCKVTFQPFMFLSQWVQDLIFCLARYLSPQFFTLPKSIWIAACPSGVSATALAVDALLTHYIPIIYPWVGYTTLVTQVFSCTLCTTFQLVFNSLHYLFMQSTNLSNLTQLTYLTHLSNCHKVPKK